MQLVGPAACGSAGHPRNRAHQGWFYLDAFGPSCEPSICWRVGDMLRNTAQAQPDPGGPAGTVVDPEEAAVNAGLRYVSDEEPGIKRQRRGKGYRYLLPRGNPVTAPATLERIRKLAIPPAYTDVWICVRGDGHIQATGRDAKGRKQ